MNIIAGIYKNRTLAVPKGLKTRPTSSRLREALFNICQGEVEGAHFLDLFAGSGAMGLEALSRGANGATFVDNSKESIRCIQSNLKHLHVEAKTEVIYGDVFDVLVKLAKRGCVFEIVYADPPYEQQRNEGEEVFSFSKKILKFIDENIGLLAPGGSLFLEDASEALPKADNLQNLVFKSSRRMGRSALQHYLRRDSL